MVWSITHLQGKLPALFVHSGIGLKHVLLYKEVGYFSLDNGQLSLRDTKSCADIKCRYSSCKERGRGGEGETEREGGRKEGQKKSACRECVKSVNALIVDITAQEFQAAIEGSCKECAHYPIVIYFSLH